MPRRAGTVVLAVLCGASVAAGPARAEGRPSAVGASPAPTALRPPGPAVRTDGRTARYVDRRVTRAPRRIVGELLGVGEGPARFVVQTASGRQVPVRFRGRGLPDRSIGARVRIRAGATGAVRSATVTSPLRTAATVAPRAHRAYVALISNRGAFGPGEAEIPATIDAALQRWREESNGAITSFTRVATRQLALKSTNDCSSGSANFNEAQATLFPDVDTGSTTGDHVIVVGPPGCATGVGTLQAGIASGGRVNAAWDRRETLQTFMHELGHNVGLNHAGACYAPLGPDCVVEQYGNTYALMGYTLSNDPAYTPAALDSFERSRLGITDPGEVLPVTLPAGQRTRTTTYDLRARGTTAGLRGLRIIDPTTGTAYSIDWRSGGGRDALSGYALDPRKDNHGVTVERISADGRTAAVLGNANPVPGAYPLFGLTAGRSFAAGGVVVTAETIGDRTDPAATSRVAVTLTDPSVAADSGAPTGPVDGPGTAPTPAPGTGTDTGTGSGTGAGPGAGTPGSTGPDGVLAPTRLAPAKLEVARASVSRSSGRLSVVAPVTARASGTVRVRFRAAGRTTTFDARIDARRRRVDIDRRLPRGQARAGTGILTLTYAGDADTQPQTVRLRVAAGSAALRPGRPTLVGGRLRASGRLSTRARGVVRVELVFQPATGATRTVRYTAPISRGRYRLVAVLPPALRAAIDGRRGVLHSSTLFTGDRGRGLRGGLASYEVLGDR